METGRPGPNGAAAHSPVAKVSHFELAGVTIRNRVMEGRNVPGRSFTRGNVICTHSVKVRLLLMPGSIGTRKRQLYKIHVATKLCSLII